MEFPVAHVQITGQPLEEAGLDGLMVRYADGTEGPLLGLVIYPGETTIGALERFCREAQATVYVPKERP